MMAMALNEAAAVLDARTHGVVGEAAFKGLSTDTRSLSAGELFVALQGPSFDGHDYVETARERGAAAALVAHRVESNLAQLEVDDTLTALGALARDWRLRHTPRVVAVTGSNGKTSVKELLAAMLSEAGHTLATPGNLNNEIGLPLTLAGLSPEHEFAVLEMGASAPGEIARLVAIGVPQVAVITLCSPAHIEGFGSIEQVAQAKGEIIAGLGHDGVAVINADDVYAPLWRRLAGQRRVVGFGDCAAADTRVRSAPMTDTHTHANAGAFESQLELDLADGLRLSAKLRLPGRHAARNALAAATAAQALGVDGASIRLGIEAAQPVKGRLAPQQLAGGHLLLDDSYNANPDSLSVGLEVLRTTGLDSVVVLGDMAELGPDSARFHHEAGKAIRSAGVSKLFATGEFSRETVGAFGGGGAHYADRDALTQSLVDALRLRTTPCALLVKGSRSTGMEHVIAALEDTFACC